MQCDLHYIIIIFSFPCLMYFQSKNSSSYYYLNLISYTFSNKKKNKKLLILIYMLITKKFMNAPHVTHHLFFIQAALDEATEPWGIKVERVEM